MPNTYSQVSIHAVFAVRNRENLITKDWRNNLHSYISGIITNTGAKSLAVGGWKDHVHIFFGLPVTQSISDFMRVVKTNSSKWINEQRFTKVRFHWQEGYGAFAYAKSQRSTVINYIMNQEEHHRNLSFREEYIQLLDEFDIKYDPRYLFDFFE